MISPQKTLKAKRECGKIQSETWERKTCNLRILHMARPSLRREGKVKNFSNKQKLNKARLTLS